MSAWEQAQHSLKRGQYEYAVSKFQEYADAQPPEHPNRHVAAFNIGSTYIAMGHLEEGVEMIEQVRHHAREWQDPEYRWCYAILLEGLAHGVSKQGQKARSLKLYRKAVRVAQKVLSPFHLRLLAIIRRALAFFVEHEQYQDALEASRESLRIYTHYRGSKHEGTLKCMQEVGHMLSKCERFDEAAEAYEEAFHLHMEVLGNEHAETRMAFHNTVTNHFSNQRFEKVFDLCAQYLEQPAFQDMPRVWNLKVLSLLFLDRIDECINAYQEALQRFPDTKRAMKVLLHVVDFLEEKGHFQDALDATRETIRLLEQNDQHKDALAETNNCALLLESCGHGEEALETLRWCMTETRKVFGTHHSNTAQVTSNMVKMLCSQSCFEEAIETARMCLVLYPSEESEGALDTMGNLVYALLETGRHEEAIRVGTKCVELHQRVYGPDSLYTNGTINLLGRAHFESGHKVEAIRLYRMCHEGMRRALGARNPDTLAAMRQVGLALENNQQHMEALQVYTECLQLADCMDEDFIKSITDAVARVHL